LNALNVADKKIEDVSVVMNGAGAAGFAIARLLMAAGIRSLISCDRQGAIYEGREGLTEEKMALAQWTNKERRKGALAEIVQGADILVGVSAAGMFTKEIVQKMGSKSIVFALANPEPEMLPDMAKEAGVFILATGRGDFPNQVNNALCYPGLFRGMLDGGINKVTDEIKLRAARAIANFVAQPTTDHIVPGIFDAGLHEAVAKSVKG
jgi:malate dehydrogenase (oxaloacetate-decarboxylating)